jgi:hypothetical protein
VSCAYDFCCASMVSMTWGAVAKLTRSGVGNGIAAFVLEPLNSLSRLEDILCKHITQNLSFH